MQAASPTSALKLPEGQAKHEPPCTANPALHLHGALVAVFVASCPGGVDGDGTQAPPLGPVKPMMHLQSCRSELAEPAAVCELSGQAAHPVLPGSALYLPCSQARHEPLSGE